ncbi:MAG TPA: diguanylate cyclase [Accumulibacter sp.]|jgi:diguanylate cyclase (GGDEF)-like protein|nr:diguanylate cyclase [Accumulibacter sp.]HQC78948.1 diguanylate cyclase [Accumulibacter sp.]
MPKATSKHLEEWANPRTVILTTTLLLAALWVVVAVSATTARQYSIATASDLLQRMTLAVDVQTRQHMRLFDALFIACEHWLTENPGRDPRHDPGFHKLVADLGVGARDRLAIRLLDEQGRTVDVLNSAAASPAGDADAGEAAHLAGEGIHIGNPIAHQAPGGRPGLPIMRAFKRPSHGIRGLVVVVDLATLTGIYDQQRPPTGGAIALVRHDGTVLARAPEEGAPPGRTLATAPYWRQLASPGRGVLVLDAPMDTAGTGEIVAYSSMAEYSLTVLVSEDYDQVLAPWRRQTLWVLLLACGITAPMLVVAYRSLRLLKALALQDAQLHRLATSDPLTGTGSRQHFVETLDADLARVRSGDASLTVLLFDIDFFKRLNDGYGHAVGDQVLISFVGAAKSCLRDEDLIGRLGAGEFAILLPNTGVDRALRVAARIREQTARIAIATDDGTVRFTSSTGVTAALATDASTDVLLKRAGVALHQAKAKGYDRIEVA